MTKAEKREHLAVVELANDVQSESAEVPGCLILSRRGEDFEITWNPFSTAKCREIQRVTAVFEDVDSLTSEWAPCKFLRAKCRDIHVLALREEGDRVFVSVRRRGTPEERIFAVDKAEFLGVARLLEQLIVNGIAVPQHSEKDPHSLVFYEKCGRNIFTNIPPYIQMDFTEFTTLDDAWVSVHAFMQEIVVHLDESQSLPIDPRFPLGDAAKSAHHHLLLKIDEYVKTLPHYEPISQADFKAMFDASGKMSDPDAFFTRCFMVGMEPNVMPDAVPFMFGTFSPDSTTAERGAQLETMKKEFATLSEQVATVKKHQLDCHKKLASSFRVITHDVNRTDRSHIAFRDDDGPGLQMLSALLKAYCLYNPTIGYLQGMNDLYVPIILTYFPNWNEDGKPVDENNNEITDYNEKLPLMFGCFEAMLNKTGHLTLLSSVTEQCQEKARIIHRLLCQVCPLVAIWMRKNNLQDLLWLYSDFVLMFKRTFDKIWPVWFQFSCNPDPEVWLVYFVAAILLKSFPEMTAISQPITITAVMDAFPKILPHLPVEDIGKIALWMLKNYPLPKTEPKPQEEIPDEFLFFKKP